MKNELETLGDLLTEFQLVKVLLAGATGEPGLLQRVEESRPVIERLTELLGQLREVSETDTQAVANLAARLDGIVETFEGFEKRVGRLVSGTFSDAFLTEQGQQLVAEVAQRLATDGARESLEKAFRVIAGELNQGAQKVADAMLAEHHVRSVAELKAENLYLKKEVEAALDKRSARIEGAFQNMLLAFVGGAVVCGLAIYAAPLIT